MARRLVLPHAFRVTGVFFLLYLALGHLPALFALPAGLGDIAAGIAAVLVALRLAQGTGRRAAVWFNAYGLTDLAVGITLGALTSYGLLHVTPSTAPIGELPLALVIGADVPLMIALHITCLVTLARAARPAPSVPARSVPARTCSPCGPASPPSPACSSPSRPRLLAQASSHLRTPARPAGASPIRTSRPSPGFRPAPQHRTQ
jgi:hypothetical protein